MQFILSRQARDVVVGDQIVFYDLRELTPHRVVEIDKASDGRVRFHLGYMGWTMWVVPGAMLVVVNETKAVPA